jgi:dTDP-4-amino-4,6-dideoxygalactose transaminase
MVPFLDLKAQHEAIRDELSPAITRVMGSCQFILGEEVSAFESEFSAYVGAKHGVAVNSGTTALHFALLAAGIGVGDEVITVPFTFVATVAAIGYVGAKPVLVDIDPHSYTICPAAFENAITERTKAVIPVHLYGQTADMDPILDIARRHGLMVIEDAAQAHGAEYRGRRAGSLGDISCFSFYPSKNLGACGEGGMLVTSDEGLARIARLLRDWGQERKYEHVLKGFNGRMDGIQGAILRVKLRHLEAWTEKRRANAAVYDRLLSGSKTRIPGVMPSSRHVYHLYAIRVRDRARVAADLRGAGIQTGVHYPSPVHLLPAYADLGYPPGSLPHSERAAQEVLSLPMFPELSPRQVEEVCEAVARSCGSGEWT